MIPLPKPPGRRSTRSVELTRGDYAFLMFATVIATLLAAVAFPYGFAQLTGAPLADIWVLPLEILALFGVYQLWLRRLAAKPHHVSEDFE